MKESRKRLKTYFQTGDQPTESEFVNWFDSSLILSGSNGITGSVIISGSTNDNADGSKVMLHVMGDITSSGNISASGTIFADNFHSTGGDIAGINFTDNIALTGNMTASGDISQSVGRLFTNHIELVGDNIFYGGDIGLPIQANHVQITNPLHGPIAAANVHSQLVVDGDITANTHITASGNISASGTILADVYRVNGKGAIGHNATTGLITLADTTQKTEIEGTNITLDAPVTASSHISGGLDKFIKAGTGSFGRLEGLSPITVGSPVIFTSPITMSGDISSSGTLFAEKIVTQEITSSFVTSSTSVLINNYTSSGNSLFGNDVNDTHKFTGHVTASGNISASGAITASGLFLPQLSTIEWLSNAGQKQTIRGTDNYIQIDGDNRVLINGDDDVAITSPLLSATGNISASGITGIHTFGGSSTFNNITGSRLKIQKSTGQGTPTPGTSDVAIFQNNDNAQDASIAIIGADTKKSQLHFGRHDDIDVVGIRYFHDNHPTHPETMQFRVNNVQRMVLKGDNLGVGGDMDPTTFLTVQGTLSGGGLTISSSNGAKIIHKGTNVTKTIDRSATNKNSFIEFDTAGVTKLTFGNIAESDDNLYIYSGDATSDKHISLTSDSTVFHTNITASNISSSGAIYSTNHEAIWQGSIHADTADATNWYGPNITGLYNNLWNADYGDNTAVLTLPEESGSAGIIVPYKSKLIGFRAMVVPVASDAVTVALYHEPANSATFNNTSGNADDATLVSVSEATSDTPGAAQNPMSITKTDSSQALEAGDMLYPRIKAGANGAYVTFTVLVQRVK